MFPNAEIALQELKRAGEFNSGPWVKHAAHVAAAAKILAGASGLNPEKAFVCGQLHDIGRRTGVAAMRHIRDGYDYAAARGWNEVARICLTHSFPVKY